MTNTTIDKTRLDANVRNVNGHETMPRQQLENILNAVHYYEHHGLKNLHKNLTDLFLPQDLWNLYMPQDLKRVPLWMNFKIKKGEKTKTDISKGYKPKRITGAFKD